MPTSSGTAAMQDRVLVRTVPHAIHLAVFYAAYVAAAGLGQGLAIVPGVTITFWPPAGIFVAALLANPRSTWPWWVVSACVAELTCNAVWFHSPLPMALAYFGANALEALTAAWLVHRFVARPFRLETLEEVVAFVVLAAGVAPVVGATLIATTDAVIGKHAFATAWPLVWLGDASGLLVSTPLAIGTVHAWRERASITRVRVLEAAAIAVAIVGTGVLAFKGYLPTAYMTMPPLLWAAVRFQLKGAAVALALVALVTAAFTAGGAGEFASAPELRLQSAIMLQSFLGISAVSVLLVAALSLQHQTAVARLRAANDHLERRVVERTADLEESRRHLSESQSRLRLAMDRAEIYAWEVDVATGAFHRSDNAARVLGIPAGRLPRTIDEARDITHPDDALTALPELQACLAGAVSSFSFEYRLLRPQDGSVVWVHSQGALEGARRVVGISQIITQRKQAEEALSRLAAIVATSSDAIVSTGLDGRITSWNAAAERMYGYSAQEMIGQPIERIVPPELRAQEAELLGRARHGESTQNFESRRVTKDGRLLDVSVAVSPIGDSTGRIIGISKIARDISDRKRIEAHAQLLMREINHRAKNLLSLVQAIARQTVAATPNEFLKRFLERLQALAANHDLLFMNQWKGVELGALARAQLSHFADLIGSRIALTGPPLRLSASAAQAIGMALHELATNAGKYGALSTDCGRVAITWCLERDTFKISWVEREGPPVAAPERRGFGTAVVTSLAEMSLHGSAVLDYAAGGVAWRLQCPAEHALEET